MTTRIPRLGLALVIAILCLPGLAPVASAASTAALSCPDGSNRLADFALQGDGFVATTGAAAVSVTGSGGGGAFSVVDTTQSVLAVLVAGPDGPIATKVDHYPGGTSAGSFDSASLVPDAGAPAAVTSVSFCGGAAGIDSAQCQDQPVFSSSWDGAGTFSVTLAGTLALCDAVEFHVATYALDAPAGWDGQPSLSPGATPQTEFDHQLLVFDVGDEPSTRSVTVVTPPCGPYQADLYTGARRTTIDAAGHGSDFVRGGLLAGTACAEPTTGPTTGPTGPAVGPAGESDAPSAMAAVDCVRTALILTLSNPGTGTGPNSGPNSAVDFAVDGVLHRVPAGEDRSVALAVAEDAAYRVLVTSPAGSQTFSGVLSCSPPDSQPSPTPPPGAAGEPNAGQPSGANVPGEPAGDGMSATGMGAALGDPDPTPSGGTEGEQALTAAGGPIAGGEASDGTAAERGPATYRGGQLAATGAPDLATASLAASGLLALGAALVLVGRSRPRNR